MSTARSPLIVVILAAGQGTRMRSDTIKLLHPVAGQPMVRRVVDAAQALRPGRLITVVGFQGDRVREALGDLPGTFVTQREQRGTGHAVQQAAREIGKGSRSTVLILNGDLPTLRASTLRSLIARHHKARASLTVLTARVDDPSGYGRVLRRSNGAVHRIVEDRDASRAERRVDEINCGIYCADPSELLAALKRLRPDNSQGEYYITDAVHDLIARGRPVGAVEHTDPAEVLGVNTRAELAQASATLFARKAHTLMDSGVTLLDPARVWIDARARIGRDTVIEPDVFIEGATRIGRNCLVRAGSRVRDCVIGDDVEIKDHSVVDSSRIGSGARVGPFAHLRPGSELGPDTKVGNFVELKKTSLGRGAKASHLSYLGDASIGADCNIGAGTITCNYDGYRKNKTVLDRGVFIGSDTQLVAPVRVRSGAYVAAGTTVTEDVPAGALAIGRTRQRNVKGWVARKRGKG